jgi:hypothetical protein
MVNYRQLFYSDNVTYSGKDEEAKEVQIRSMVIIGTYRNSEKKGYGFQQTRQPISRSARKEIQIRATPDPSRGDSSMNRN